MSEAKVIAITGASGFLGMHVARLAYERGYTVRAHVHQTDERSEKLKEISSDIICCEIDDYESISKLVQPADVVVHLVSNFRSSSEGEESYRGINVEGTKKVFKACVEHKVDRLVYCSTIGVHGDVKVTPTVETSPYNPGDLYQETKLEAENYLKEQAKKSGLDLVVIRPCSLYGPGDTRMLKMFRMLKNRTFFFLGPCEENFHPLYVTDAAEYFVEAVESVKVVNEVFIVGGPDGYMPLREYVNTVASALSVKKPYLNFPYWPFYFLGYLCEKVCIPFGIEPILHRRRVKFYKNNRAFDTSKANECFNYSARYDLDQGLDMTIQWYKSNKYL